MPRYAEPEPPKTPRSAAKARLDRKAFLRESIRNAAVGDRVDYEWRLIDPEDEDWEVSPWSCWKGGTVIATGDDMRIRWPLGCDQLTEEVTSWPPTFDVEEGGATWIFQVRDVNIRKLVRPKIVFKAAPQVEAQPEPNPPGGQAADIVARMEQEQAMPDEHATQPTQKRPREELFTQMSSAEAVADALRGNVEKIVLAPLLKIPRYIEERFGWAYPHLYLRDPRRWTDDLRDFQMDQNLFLSDGAALFTLDALKTDIRVWLEEHEEIPHSKSALRPLIGKIGNILMLFVQQRTKTNTRKMQLDVDEALEKGFVDFAELWRNAVRPSNSNNKQNNSSPRGRGGGGWNRQRARGGISTPPAAKPKTA
jgi:hypothetical protein